MPGTDEEREKEKDTELPYQADQLREDENKTKYGSPVDNNSIVPNEVNTVETESKPFSDLESKPEYTNLSALSYENSSDRLGQNGDRRINSVPDNYSDIQSNGTNVSGITSKLTSKSSRQTISYRSLPSSANDVLRLKPISEQTLPSALDRTPVSSSSNDLQSRRLQIMSDLSKRIYSEKPPISSKQTVLSSTVTPILVTSKESLAVQTLIFSIPKRDDDWSALNSVETQTSPTRPNPVSYRYLNDRYNDVSEYNSCPKRNTGRIIYSSIPSSRNKKCAPLDTDRSKFDNCACRSRNHDKPKINCDDMDLSSDIYQKYRKCPRTNFTTRTNSSFAPRSYSPPNQQPDIKMLHDLYEYLCRNNDERVMLNRNNFASSYCHTSNENGNVNKHDNETCKSNKMNDRSLPTKPNASTTQGSAFMTKLRDSSLDPNRSRLKRNVTTATDCRNTGISDVVLATQVSDSSLKHLTTIPHVDRLGCDEIRNNTIGKRQYQSYNVSHTRDKHASKLPDLNISRCNNLAEIEPTPETKIPVSGITGSEIKATLCRQEVRYSQDIKSKESKYHAPIERMHGMSHKDKSSQDKYRTNVSPSKLYKHSVNRQTQTLESTKSDNPLPGLPSAGKETEDHNTKREMRSCSLQTNITSLQNENANSGCKKCRCNKNKNVLPSIVAPKEGHHQSSIYSLGSVVGNKKRTKRVKYRVFLGPNSKMAIVPVGETSQKTSCTSCSKLDSNPIQLLYKTSSQKSDKNYTTTIPMSSDKNSRGLDEMIGKRICSMIQQGKELQKDIVRIRRKGNRKQSGQTKKQMENCATKDLTTQKL